MPLGRGPTATPGAPRPECELQYLAGADIRFWPRCDRRPRPRRRPGRPGWPHAHAYLGAAAEQGMTCKEYHFDVILKWWTLTGRRSSAAG